MIDDWKQVLEDAGAVIEDGKVLHYGDPGQEARIALTHRVIADLSHLGLIAIKGEDAPAFIQSQFTNDARLIRDNQAQISAYLNPKGRALALFHIFKRDNVYYLCLPAALAESTLSRLRMFVLRSKVTLENAGNTLIGIGYAAPPGDGFLKEVMGAVPEDFESVIRSDSLTAIRLRDPHPRYHIFGSREAMQKLWTRLNAQATPIGSAAWELLDIHAGIPVVYPETVDAFVPQMLNLHLIGGVNFQKGCYPGQEIVARVHYLGKAKRSMYRLHCQTDITPKPGDAVYNPAATGEQQAAGTIVCAQAAPEGGCEALTVIEITAIGSGTLHLNNPSGPECQLKPLPYSGQD